MSLRKVLALTIVPAIMLGLTACPGVDIPPLILTTLTSFGATTGSIITFDAGSIPVSESEVLLYKWLFGDGNEATGKVVEHSYSAPGLYQLVLQVFVERTTSAGVVETAQVSAQEEVILEFKSIVEIGQSPPTLSDFGIQNSFVTPNFDDPDTDIGAAVRNDTVRRAITLSIDRLALVNDAYNGEAVPQYSPSSVGGVDAPTFFLGRENTCEEFDLAGLTSPTMPCLNGQWRISGDYQVPVTALPTPSTDAIKEQLGCLVDYASCVAKAKALLDSVGIFEVAGTRQIPANFDGFGNPGGPFAVEVATNSGNLEREALRAGVCSGFSAIDIDCTEIGKLFSVLVDELLMGTYTGFIVISLSGGAPLGSANVAQCGAALHFFHISCDPVSITDPTQQTPGDAQIQAFFDAANYDAWQRGFIEFSPYMHLTVPASTVTP
jgi:ABC-type transport system substrate-binding protein